MKHIVFKSDDKKEILNAQIEFAKDIYKSVLVQIFSSLEDDEKLKKLVKKFVKRFPNAVVIGSTTAGEISHAKMHDNATIISVSLFESTTLKVGYTKKTDAKSGVKLSSKICKKDTKAVVILSEGLAGEDYEGFIDSFNKLNPNLIIAGGLAGDNFKLKKTYIFCNGKVYDKGSVAVSFSSKTLYADHRYNLNWVPIGKEFTITKSDNNILYEIDGQKAKEVFKKYLGDYVFANDAKSLSYFQLLYKDGLTVVARTPLSVNDDAIVFAGPLKEGQKVQFGFSNASSLISGSTHINNLINKNPAEGIYVFSCIARKNLLGNVLEKELDNFESVAPISGFFTYGEYYTTGQNNALLNSTTTVLILSESQRIVKNRKTKKIVYDRENVTFNALTHFVKQTSIELDENVKLLNQYKDAVDASLLVSKTDKEGKITYVNDNFCKISGYKYEELIGKGHNIVRDKRVSSFIFKKMWDTISSGKVWRGQFPNRAKDGSEYYVDATIMPTYNDGVIEGYIAIRQDITKQINIKRRLEEKEKFIKAIFDNQDNIVVLATKKDGLISVNNALFEYFDFKDFDDFKSQYRCICDLFLEEEGYLVGDNTGDWLEKVTQNPHKDYKSKMIGKDGKNYIFKVKVNKVKEQYIVNLSDITNLEHALQKAYSSEKAKSMFLANMSHEIRTPLNGILGFTDVLMNRDLDKQSYKYVDIIHKSGKSLLNIVNDILDFSKIESGEFSLYKTKSDLFSEMEVVVSTFAASAKGKNIDYYVYIDTNIPKELLCDVQRIKQVISNLISNALKFTPEKGHIDVGISLKELKDDFATLKFSIKDSGIGIAKDKIKTIFEAFSQADNSISRNFGGTGLGLSISSKFIDMMGGKLQVQSVENEGSDFYFSLTFPVINSLSSMEISTSIDKNIVILQPNQDILCSIYNNVQTYLDTWRYKYKVINSLDELDSSVDILIICSKLFDEKTCRNALEYFSKLQLVYIEGGDDYFNCSHDRFHLVAQPMTGSALFDTIVKFIEDQNLNQSKKVQNKNNKYNAKVLVAEDNLTNQLLIEVMLTSRDIDFVIVSNGQEAVDEALANHYDLIFMDINMPILDGVSATKKLREKGYDKTIISLSANVIDADVKSYKEAGVNDSLSKPIVPAELDAMLDKYLVSKEEVQEDEVIFDSIDVQSISSALSIDNKDIILKLLQSFSKSSQTIISKLESQNLDKDILHNIKGISGNLRFSNLYNLSQKLESEIDDFSEVEYKRNKELILKHLHHIIDSINLLNH